MRSQCSLNFRKKTRERRCYRAGQSISGGAKPKILEEIDGAVNRTVQEKEVDAIEFGDFEDGLFEGGTKKRKTKKDKRTPRGDWRRRVQEPHYKGVRKASSKEIQKNCSKMLANFHQR